MDAVAYIDADVIKFVNDTLIPLRLAAADPVLGPRYRVKWTPTLLILDAEGVEQYRTLGFYPPQELIPSLLLGIGKARFNQPDRPAACDCFSSIIDRYPLSSITDCGSRSDFSGNLVDAVNEYIRSHGLK